MNGSSASLLAALGLSLLTSCGESSTRKLVITGASTIAPLVLEIGKRFEAAHPDVQVDVQSGGSGRGVADTRQGLADIGMVSRALAKSESDLLAHPIALDGVTVIVHAENPVRALADEQVVAIYSGRTTNWKDVGGRDAPITVVNKAEGRSTLELFCKHYRLENADIRAHVVIGDNQQGIKTVAGNEDSIGYVSIGTAEYEASHGAPIRLLAIGGVEASVANVGNGTFPLSRPLNLVTKGEATGLAREFLEFARSPLVSDLVREQSFVPIED
jgi:phosphate transport system substrate-binding protein